jgi:hypothetical protein
MWGRVWKVDNQLFAQKTAKYNNAISLFIAPVFGNFLALFVGRGGAQSAGKASRMLFHIVYFLPRHFRYLPLSIAKRPKPF